MQIFIQIVFSIFRIFFIVFDLNMINVYLQEIGLVISWLFVIKKFIFKNNNFDMGFKTNFKGIIFVIFFMTGYIILYENTLSVLEIQEAEWLMDYINEQKEHILILIINTVLVAPVFEELVFRTVILKGLLKRYNVLKAIILSSLLFGIYHGNLSQGISALTIGIKLGFLYYRTESLILCVIVFKRIIKILVYKNNIPGNWDVIFWRNLDNIEGIYQF